MNVAGCFTTVKLVCRLGRLEDLTSTLSMTGVILMRAYSIIGGVLTRTKIIDLARHDAYTSIHDLIVLTRF